jgi:hypothetical protein
MSRLFSRKPSRRVIGGDGGDGAFSHTKSVALNKTYRLGPSREVRDAIIDLVLHLHSAEPFCAPFVAHLRKLGRRVLDGYSELEFVLEEYRVRLVFRTSQMEVNEMTYTLSDLHLEPDPQLLAPPSLLGWLLGRGRA